MESLQDEVLLEDVRTKLKMLKHDLNDKYRDIIQRVGNQNPSRCTIAVNALTWITHARRPLMVEELQHALAVSPEDQQYKPGRMPRVDDIIAFCCGMVVLERSSNTFRLVHNTAREFMKGLTTSDERFKDPHCYISLVIANYLCMPALEQPDDPDQGISYAVDLDDYPHRHDEHQAYEIQRQGYRRPADERRPNGLSYQKKMCTFPLARYAGMYLGHHLRAIQNPDSTLAANALQNTFELLSQRPKRLFYERLLDQTSSYPPPKPDNRYMRWTFNSEIFTDDDDDISELSEVDFSDEEGNITTPPGPSREITPLHLAAHIGIPELVARFLSDTSLLQVRDYARLNPLGVALCSGYTDVVLSLLKAGSNLDLRSSEGCHLLLFAAQSDSRAEEVVHRILEHSLLIPDKGGNVVLKYLAWFWILAITKLRYYSSRILQLCHAKASCWKTCRLDPEEESLSLNVDVQDTTFKKKVHFSPSAEEIEDKSPILSQVRIARTYSEAIFPRERQEQRDYIKLVAAALQNDCEKIESLVEEGKVLLNPRQDGRRHQRTLRLLVNLALFLALEKNNIEVVKLLIDGGVSVESRDFNYRTPLHRAVIRSNIALVDYLMNHGAKVDPKDYRQETPWTLAVRNHDEKSEFFPTEGTYSLS
jgi:ankyrin repeat protein